MSTAITIDHISKKYRLGAISSSTLRDDVNQWWARVRGKPNPLDRLEDPKQPRLVDEQFWALRDVSFEVKEGDVVGIIGRNGAGKSTLLKILSQITAPTSGEIRMTGRIASLLEVGTGFHPDLSGRENVYLNGAILGMTKPEIHRQFDEIVAFSECEDFIDTPVKRYSSGMYVRLAFAVAAHLDPEILVVDEVLAVGDAKFQRKCLGKMHSVAALGRTILFVSHNTLAVRRLCKSAVMLRDGVLVAQGPVDTVLSEYDKESLERSEQGAHYEAAPAPGRVTVTRVAALDADDLPGTIIAPGAPFSIETTIHSHTDMPDVTIGCSIATPAGNTVLTSLSTDVSLKETHLRKGAQTFRVAFTPNYLQPGPYLVTIGVVDEAWTLVSIATECITFGIAEAELSPEGAVYRRAVGGALYTRPGDMLIPLTWSQVEGSTVDTRARGARV